MKNNHLTQLNFTERKTEAPKIQPVQMLERNEKYDTEMKKIHSADFKRRPEI